MIAHGYAGHRRPTTRKRAWLPPRRQAIMRYAQPSQIAAAVVHPLAGQAAFVTGLALPPGGGAAITVKT